MIDLTKVTEKQEVVDFFFVNEAPTIKKSKRGDDYWCLTLQNKTGELDARIWDKPKGDDLAWLKAKTFVKVSGGVDFWKDTAQLAVKQIRLAVEGEYNWQDFFERSPRDPQEAFDNLMLISTQSMRKPLGELCQALLLGCKDKLLKAPAAKSVHHAYIGGLLEHVEGMCQAASAICQNYQELDEDLLLTGCIVHDIGKLTELTYPIGIGYALEGTLIGHISIGLIVVTAAMNTLSFPTDLALKVQHLVISHHGKLEWGSSKVPIMREAVVLHHIDMIDSSLNIFKRAEKQGIDADGLTPWVKVMDGPLYIGAPAPVTAE